jgi:hypothetical protein
MAAQRKAPTAQATPTAAGQIDPPAEGPAAGRLLVTPRTIGTIGPPCGAGTRLAAAIVKGIPQSP